MPKELADSGGQEEDHEGPEKVRRGLVSELSDIRTMMNDGADVLIIEENFPLLFKFAPGVVNLAIRTSQSRRIDTLQQLAVRGLATEEEMGTLQSVAREIAYQPSDKDKELLLAASQLDPGGKLSGIVGVALRVNRLTEMARLLEEARGSILKRKDSGAGSQTVGFGAGFPDQVTTIDKKIELINQTIDNVLMELGESSVDSKKDNA